MNSTRYAALLAGVYVAINSAYIVLSSALAAGASHSVEELRRIETIKGVVYVVVIALLIFLGARWAMRRMERDAEELRRREKALLVNEGRVFAGLIAASIAHDANNVLMVALSELDQLEEQDGQSESHARLRQAVERLVGLNRRLLDSTQGIVPAGQPPLDARESARETLAMLRGHADLRRCQVSCDGDARVLIAASPALMHQLVGNLVLNAAQATGGQGRVEIRVYGHEQDAMIEVHDDGPGVPLDRRPELFTALTSTKSGGQGLGLFSVKACATRLGGGVEVGDSPLGGALFRIRLSLAPATILV